MIVARGYGKNINNPSSIVSYGYSSIKMAWRLIKEFILTISKKWEVNLER